MLAHPSTGDFEPNLVPEMLRNYASLVKEALVRYLPSGEPNSYLYELIRDYPMRGGKMMRPGICIAAAQMFGGKIEDALPTAVAAELLHNALLIHDDIEDESEVRRGQPTLHRMHGIPLAINAGDGLAMAAMGPLLDNRRVIGDWLTMEIFEETRRTAIKTAEGQAVELGWRRDNNLDLDDADYLEMVLRKTCWLATIFPLRAGAIIGSCGTADPSRLMRFGFLLGAAFQIQDDLLNLAADERYGKERDGDLWEGKRTLILINAARQADPDERAHLHEILGTSRADRSTQSISWLRALIAKYRSIEYTRRVAHGLAGAAIREFALLSEGLPPSREKTFLERMPIWVIERQ
jgi:geranylgeranyl diphosphate synthase type II